ncbi:ABC transporter permease [Paenibacillaceae bacterium WGS1546]|uniref:ABC transporter permease n=1 Tax=Cohnella sp. WGS1546 TaxID=3366810 RepID=UPI00372D848A
MVIVRKLVQAIVVIWFISVVVFFAVRLAPGDPVMTVLGAIGNNAEKADLLREQMGLNDPLILQYFKWIGGVLQGDFGHSLISGKPVLEIVLSRLPASLELIAFSILIGLIVAIPLGIAAAVLSGKWVDKLFSLISILGMSTPVFWLGLLLIYFFSIQMQWLPASGYVSFSDDPWQHLKLVAMPAIVLGISEAAVFFRFIRNGMLDVLKEPFMETARAKGLSPVKIYLKHGFRNTLLTFMTVLGLEIGILVSGTVIVEQVFSWTGIGWLVLNSVSTRDYTLLQGTVLLVSVAVVLVNLILNMLYSFLDPRVKMNEREG